jgi:hypothetical protein
MCGPACCAMLSGMSLRNTLDAISYDVERDSGMTTKEMVTALRTLGLSCPDRLKTLRLGKLPPSVAVLCIKVPLVRVRNGKRCRPTLWHWAVYSHGLVWDPGGNWPEDYPPGTRITSYLEIRTS